MLGICMEEVPPQNYRYKSIVEVLDERAVLTEELLNLAQWMARYYHCSVGKAIFAMLPARLQADVDALATWIGTQTDIPEQYQTLYSVLQNQEKQKLTELKKKLPD